MQDKNKKNNAFTIVILLVIAVCICVIPHASSAFSDGTEDTAFYTNLGTGIGGSVYLTSIQSNGKILVGGFFTTLNGATQRYFAPLNADGTVDTAFNANLGTGFGSVVQAISTQSDGKILVGGAFTTLNGITRNRFVRLNTDGTVDTAFYTNLGTGFNNSIRTLSIQSDGKILVGGDFTTLNGTTRNYLVRLNTDGTVDTSFYANLGTGFGSSVYMTSIQSDGKILVGGGFTTLNGITRNRFVRLNTDGTVDTTFYTNLGTGFDSVVQAISIQSDGKIVLGGSFTALNGTTRNRLVRLNADGTEDTAFYTNLGTGFDVPVLTTSAQSDGKILVGGFFATLNGTTRNRFVRLNTNGTVDTAFHTNLGTGFGNTVRNISIQSDGKILVGGDFTTLNGTTRNRLVRLSTAPDITPPTLTSIATSSLSTTGATITWTTDEVATSTILYGLTTAYGTASSSAVATTSHSITLSGLTLNTLYHFQVNSYDSVGNLATSSDVTFTTDAEPTPTPAPTPTSSGGPLFGSGISSEISTNDNIKKRNPTDICTPHIQALASISIQNTGNNADTVRKIQTFLNTYEKETLIVDGIYKKADVDAIKRFQVKYRAQILSPYGLTTPTGIVFRATIAKMNAVVCGEKLSCPVFTLTTDKKSTHQEVPRIKSFLNQTVGSSLNTSSSVVDAQTIRAISQFQTQYKEVILKPLNLSRATGLWYQATIKQANRFMGCE